MTPNQMVHSATDDLGFTQFTNYCTFFAVNERDTAQSVLEQCNISELLYIVCGQRIVLYTYRIPDGTFGAEPTYMSAAENPTGSACDNGRIE